MAGEFWLLGQQCAVLEPLLPINQPGPERVDDRRGVAAPSAQGASGCGTTAWPSGSAREKRWRLPWPR
jgi:transposase